MDFLATYIGDSEGVDLVTPSEREKPASGEETNGEKEEPGTMESPSKASIAPASKPFVPKLFGLLQLGQKEDKCLDDPQDFSLPPIVEGDTMLMTPLSDVKDRDYFALTPVTEHKWTHNHGPRDMPEEAMRTVFLTPKSNLSPFSVAPDSTNENEQPDLHPEPSTEGGSLNAFLDFFKGGSLHD